MIWQPIDTAPKDGRSVLLFSPDFDEIQIAFYRDSGSVGAMGKYVWQLHDDGGALAEQVPSHWMPLPERPVKS